MSTDIEVTDFDCSEFLERQSAGTGTEDLDYVRGNFKPRDHHVQKNSHPYEPKFARWTEKFRLIGAQLSDLEDFFAVDHLTMEAWAREHPEFAHALDTQPTALGVSSEDIGLFNWLKDYRRGELGL